MYKTLLNIDSELNVFIREIENHFSIKVDKKIIDKIYQDFKNDQVNEKEYVIFKRPDRILKKQFVIKGIVDEYEPETIWIELENLRKKDIVHLDSWIKDLKNPL